MIAKPAPAQALSVWTRFCLDTADYLVLVKDGGQSLTNNIRMGRGETPGGWKQEGCNCMSLK
jgi:hypothetical protein